MDKPEIGRMVRVSVDWHSSDIVYTGAVHELLATQFVLSPCYVEGVGHAGDSTPMVFFYKDDWSYV